MGITSTQQNNEPLILNEMPDGEYRGLVQMLKARYTGKSVLKNYKLLNSGRLKTMRCELGALKLILLDELSIIENNMFTVQLNKRLKELKGSKDDFGGVSMITIGDLFQLKPVMDGYVFTDVPCLNSCNILAPNLWRRYFKMFELDLIMRQRESKMFAEILNRLYEADLGKT